MKATIYGADLNTTSFGRVDEIIFVNSDSHGSAEAMLDRTLEHAGRKSVNGEHVLFVNTSVVAALALEA